MSIFLRGRYARSACDCFRAGELAGVEKNVRILPGSRYARSSSRGCICWDVDFALKKFNQSICGV